MIILWPFNGLCNRMRAIASAAELSRKTGKRLLVIWVASSECGCRYDELFEPHPDVYKVLEFNAGLLHRQLLKLVKLALWLSIFRKFNQQQVEEKFQDKNHWIRQAVAKNLSIKTHSDFFDPTTKLDSFVPKRRLQDVIDKLKLSSNIGIHIRGQDNIPAKEVSTPRHFESAIEERLEMAPSTQFFLATDEGDVEKHLIEKFFSKIIHHPKSDRSRSQKNGVQDALIDLYCLSNCAQIWGSHRSSFSEIAARLRGVNLTIIGE